jgi:hypothetical protein
MHIVLQAVALAQTNPPEQAFGVPAVHVPVPLHDPRGVSIPLEQETVPQGVVEAACSHMPPAAHFPMFPQVSVTAHCPAGAGIPGR